LFKTHFSYQLNFPDQIPPTLPPEITHAYAGEIAPPKGGENPVWNLWDVLGLVLFAIASFFMLTFLAIVVVSAIHYLPRFRDMNPTAVFKNVAFGVALQTAVYAVALGFMALLIARKGQRGFFREISWNSPTATGGLGAIFGGVAMAVGSLTCSVLLQKWIPKELPIDSYMKTRASAYAVALFGIVVAPLVEELFFRGFLYPALARKIGMAAGVIFTSAGFALMHEGQLARAWAPLLVIFLVGVCLTVVRAATKSVAFTVLMHMSYNTTLFALMFLVTEGFRHMKQG
jgi:membrane protease YdiL (CAAX protease family)